MHILFIYFKFFIDNNIINDWIVNVDTNEETHNY